MRLEGKPQLAAAQSSQIRESQTRGASKKTGKIFLLPVPANAGNPLSEAFGTILQIHW